MAVGVLAAPATTKSWPRASAGHSATPAVPVLSRDGGDDGLLRSECGLREDMGPSSWSMLPPSCHNKNALRLLSAAECGKGWYGSLANFAGHYRPCIESPLQVLVAVSSGLVMNSITQPVRQPSTSKS